MSIRHAKPSKDCPFLLAFSCLRVPCILQASWYSNLVINYMVDHSICESVDCINKKCTYKIIYVAEDVILSGLLKMSLAYEKGLTDNFRKFSSFFMFIIEEKITQKWMNVRNYKNSLTCKAFWTDFVNKTVVFKYFW